MSMYRREWACCGSVTETDAWEPDSCPFCTPDRVPQLMTLTVDQIICIAVGIRERNHNIWPGDIAFARAIESAILAAKEQA